MRSSRRLIGPAVAASLLAGTLIGCGGGPELVEVAGVATLDGQPLANVLVTFVPETASESRTVRSMGLTDQEGKFELLAESQRPGAVLGKHRVLVEDLSIHSAPRSEDGTLLSRPAPRFPARYSDLQNSPLRAEVAKDSPPIRVELVSGGK